MKRGILFSGAIIVLALLAQGCNLLDLSKDLEELPPPPSRNVEGLDFASPVAYEDFMAKSKVRLIFFTIEIDPTGPDVQSTVLTLENRYPDDLLVLRAAGDDDEWVDVVARHEVKYFPTLILIDEQGEESVRWEGYVDLKTVEQATRELIDF